MTSREDIETLDYMLTLILNDKGIERWNRVKKDLKVLDILKENAHLYVNDVNKDVKSIQINITTCDDRFDKVEEWLGEK